MIYSRSVILVVALATLAACSQSSPPPAAQQPAAPPAPTYATTRAPGWTDFANRFVEDYFVANPPLAAGAGRHEFDGQLPDWSAAGLDKEVKRLEQQRAWALEFKEADLTLEQRFQRAYLIARTDTDLFWRRDLQEPVTNVSYYFDYGLDPSTYVTVPYAPVEQRARAFIKYAQGVPNAIAQIKSVLKTPMPRTFVDYGIAGFNGFADFFRKDVSQAFAEAKDPQVQKDLAAAIEPAAQAMADMAKWLEAQKAQANDDFAIGTERFAKMVSMTEGVTTPVERLAEIGQRDLDRNLVALREGCAKYAKGQSITACIAKVNADKPTGGAVEGARGQLADLKKYLIEHKVVSVPGTEEALVAEAPAYKRQNFAYINIPGPYEKDMPSTYYIAPPDASWSKAEQDAYTPGKADLLFTSVHEVWPGHFLQFLHSNRSSWRFGQLFVGYAFAEGWAHYGEELMIEDGFAKDQPELHIGQLLNALLRNVRYMCAIGLHTKGMTVAQCEQMFKDKAYQDAGNARQQASRGTYDPAYLNYTMGKLMIRKLREDWLAANPNKTRLQFHDQFLSFGGPPIPLVREQMMNAKGGELF
jgi:uncharacterized protein (DUF885 family)